MVKTILNDKNCSWINDLNPRRDIKSLHYIPFLVIGTTPTVDPVKT
tara:strand:- start:358 stop:495 length:138 start_codon:yes stop_codon:yes gene_type:complete